MPPSRPPLLAALALTLVTLGSARGQTVTLGSPLTQAPNISFGCEAQPALLPDASGNFGLFQSGVPDCTWRQSGVFGIINDPRVSSVPGDGRIISISVRSGPNPAPLRFVILRQLAAPGFGDACCFFVRETAPVQPQPNTVSTFAVDIPVERNTIVRDPGDPGDPNDPNDPGRPGDGTRAVDLVAISAASGTGSLPLFSTGRNNSFQFTEPGSVNASFFYPRMGAIPNDSAGGRSEGTGIPGVELLVNFTWCPAGVGGGPGQCAGRGGGGGGGAGLRSQNGQVANGRALIDLICNGNAACRGVLELLNPTARSVVTNAKKGAARFGKQSYDIQAGATATVSVKLNRKGRRLLRRLGALAVTVRLTPTGGSPVTGNVLLTP
jgi:hypothetical protein